MLKLISAALIVAASTLGALAQEMELARDGAVNKRAGPGTDYKIVGRFEPDTKGAFQMRRSGQWISLSNGGWVHADLLKQKYPVQPVPEPNIYVVKPTSGDGVFPEARSASGRFGVFTSDKLEEKLSRLVVFDLTTKKVLRSLTSFQPEISTRFQFLTDTLLLATGEPPWGGGYAEYPYRGAVQETLIDLASDTVIYQGTARFHQILHPPAPDNEDYFVTDNLALIRMSAATHDVLDRFFLISLFPEFESDIRGGGVWVRKAGVDAKGRPTFIANLPVKRGPLSYVARFDSWGKPIGQPIPLDPGEYLLDISPDGSRFATISSSGGRDSLLTDALAQIPFHDPAGSVDWISPWRLQIRDVQTGAVRASLQEDAEEISIMPGRDVIFTNDGMGEPTRLWRWQDLTEVPPADPAEGHEQIGLERLQSSGLPFAPAYYPTVMHPDTQTVIIPNVLNQPDLMEAYPDGLPGVTLDELTMGERSEAKQQAPFRERDWRQDLSIYSAARNLRFDFQTMTARPTIFEAVPQQWGVYELRNNTDVERSFGDDGYSGIHTDFGDWPLGPSGGILAFEQGKRLGVILPGSDDFIALQGVSPGSFMDEAGMPRSEQVLGSIHLSGMRAYGDYDPERQRARSAYVVFSTTRSLDRILGMRASLCADADCIRVADDFWSADFNVKNGFLYELVVFDATTGQERAAWELARGCEFNGRDTIAASMAQDDIVYVWTGCGRAANIVRLDLRDGATSPALATALTDPDDAITRDLLQRKHSLSRFDLFEGDRIMGFRSSDDGTISLIERETGRRLADLYVYPDSSWLLLTTDGFYTMGRDGDKNLAVAQGLNVASIDRFRTALFRPDLVFETLAGDPERIVERARRDLSLSAVMASGGAPKAGLSVDLDGAVAHVDVAVSDQGGGVGAVEIRVNGVVRHREVGLTKARIDIPLAEGMNQIEAVARNRAEMIESRSEPERVTVAPEDVAPPRLFVLAVGVDDYAQDALKLNYAASDARRVAEAFDIAGASLYGEIETLVMTDAEVTRAGLAATFTELSQRIRPNDVFVFFVAGHGKTVDGRYNFVPVDFTGSTVGDLRDAGIGQTQMAEWFAMISAQKSLMLFDTCDSGSLVESSVGLGLSNVGSSELLGNSTGRAILSASSSQGVALEGYQGSGLFTHVLIEALATGDHDDDGLIDVFELADEVAKRLPVLAQEAFTMDQQSAFRRPSFSFNVIRSAQ